jgi:hypothetical protein
LAEVTSIVRDRGRALGVVAALVASVALVSAPAAFGNVDGDPIASATFSVKLSSGFKHQLKRNHVKMKPKKLKFLTGDVDPTTGAGDLTLGRLKFKKGKKSVACGKLTASLGPGGKIKGAQCGKLFKLSGGTATRNGFGASVSGGTVKFVKSAAKQLNKRLELHSLHKGKAGALSLSYQPTTVKVTGGLMTITPALSLGSVAVKIGDHCMDPIFAIDPIPPMERISGIFHFPVTGGTISPAGNDGVVQTAGGLRLQNGRTGNPFTDREPADCPHVLPGRDTSTSWLEQTNLAPNFGLQNLQANAVLGGTNPGCQSLPGDPQNPPGCGVVPGDKGVAIAQNLDVSNATVNPDPNSHTIEYDGIVIKNNALSSLVLGQGLTPDGQPAGLFPNLGDPANDFQEGDIFGTADITMQVR